MFVRFTSFKIASDRMAEAKKIFNDEVVPVVRDQKGNISIRLLEPEDKADDIISMTEWKTKADADAYERSGLYKKLVKKLDGFFTKEPVLKTYTTEDVKVFTGNL